jgi:UDP-glucose 4-epimerase
MSNRAIVTGVGGFLGGQLAQALVREGWEVAGVGHAGGDGTRVRECLRIWVEEDVSLESLRRAGLEASAVFHCAGGASVAASYGAPQADFFRTVGATSGVLEYARLASAPCAVIYPSSSAVYGQSERQPITEDCPLSPTSPYGWHKLQGEQLCQMYGACFGVPIVRVRLFSVFGAGLRKQLLWDACNKAALGEFRFGGTGGETRDWIHVTDAVRLLILAAAQANPASPVVNGGTGVAPPVEEVLSWLGQRLSFPGAPSFSGCVRAGDPVHYQACCARAREWGWAPEVTWREGMADYARWFKTSTMAH